MQNSPLGTTQAPPFDIANWWTCAPSLAANTSTMTFPSCTKKHICIFLEFFARLKPAGGNSTMPEPKKGIVIIFAYLNFEPATSRVMIEGAAKAMSSVQR